MKHRDCKVVMTILLFLVNLGYATTYYVDRNHAQASNSNPGTLNLPWLTIQHAAETLVAGDSVFIRDGVYNEQVLTQNDGNGSAGDIVFVAYPGETPAIDGTGVSSGNTGIIISNSYLKLIGLEVRNWTENGIWIQNAAFFEISDCVVHDVVYGIGIADGCHDFVLNRVEAHHYDLYGFDVSPSGGADSYNGTFNDCIAHTGRDPQQNVDGFALGHGTQHDFVLNRCKTYNVFDGFDISSQRSTLNRCEAYNCWNGCYKLWQDDVTLINCLGYNSNGSIVELDWDGSPGVTTLMNCTFYNGQTYTVWIENAADTLHMYNCILAGGDNIALCFEQMGVGNYRGDYNLFHNDNAARAVVVGYTDEFSLQQIQNGEWTTYSGQDSHRQVETTAINIFEDPANSNLHLLASSIAVDNGTSNGAPAEDFEGNPRPSGTDFDIGAYEYQQSSGGIMDQLLVPGTTCLYQNYPNPFNPTTIIAFDLSKSCKVTLKVYNILGEEVATLLSESLLSGSQSVEWNASNLVSGVYLNRLQAGDYVETRKMVLMR